ncbi:3D domain-containing protein [Pullulanibacillus sp. KACC 23026]|uniref:3D domain-containing protein n=1 Tax=Pullulanibacillus sp. KACC 23026 TaxID=3028315 RepID=UPI0023AE9858|nr:3D domain-containing protein [Pullulanibacillus sp. KACC 23026]WEG11198.1 3D domain-containing protein [Pullulanibacillus sp. KACC 23026]
MLNKLKKMTAIAGLSGLLFVTSFIQAHAATKTVTVHKGDTLWGLAKGHHVTVSELKKWNKLKSNIIHPGLKLNVSGDTHTAKKAAPKPKKSSKAAKVSSKKLTVKASAYTASCAGCTGLTTTGFNLKKHSDAKIIAVDPKVIPLGSKVHVEGYGDAVAADTGGAIKGNKIDVFVSSKQKALKFGVKKVQVTVY